MNKNYLTLILSISLAVTSNINATNERLQQTQERIDRIQESGSAEEKEFVQALESDDVSEKDFNKLMSIYEELPKEVKRIGLDKFFSVDCYNVSKREIIKMYDKKVVDEFLKGLNVNNVSERLANIAEKKDRSEISFSANDKRRIAKMIARRYDLKNKNMLKLVQYAKKVGVEEYFLVGRAFDETNIPMIRAVHNEFNIKNFSINDTLGAFLSDKEDFDQIISVLTELDPELEKDARRQVRSSCRNCSGNLEVRLCKDFKDMLEIVKAHKAKKVNQEKESAS